MLVTKITIAPSSEKAANIISAFLTETKQTHLHLPKKTSKRIINVDNYTKQQN